jgi:translation initiation factor 2B subunit (eIF-2B alpha/beta/delta family)
MPLIANAVRLVQEIGDAGAVVSQLDLERRKLAEKAVGRLAGYDSVVTISNSSAVTDTLKLSGIRSAQVVVAGPDDEGHATVRILRRAGLSARAVLVSDIDAEIGLVGCDAVFSDGSFVNRRGTAALARELAPLVLLVLAESLKRVDGDAPKTWPEPELFEIVGPMANIQVLAADWARSGRGSAPGAPRRR